MSDIAIEVETLSKLYRIGLKDEIHDTLGEAVTSFVRQPLTNLRRLRRLTQFSPQDGNGADAIWALKDVSFQVKQGEVIGIIGRNGAGKSTLLKILSRITEPTTGRVVLNGRVASLLEVGTGFHPELTGRENIYLNGAILGMTRAEIDRKFDEIVDFSGVEKFIDTPVKRYSSGMRVRLAFSVAAHLEPEILLVDEVLAVGDAEFQKKCLGKMGEVAKAGRTVLFVSHNMAAILSLCIRSYLLDHGNILCCGTTENVVDSYMARISAASQTPLNKRIDRNCDGRVRLTSISVDNGNMNSSIRCGDSLRIRIGYTASQEVLNATFLISIHDQFNRPIFFLDSGVSGGNVPLRLSGFVTCETSSIDITPGLCIVNVAVLLGGRIADHVKHAHAFEVEADDFYGNGKLLTRQEAICLLRQEWRAETA